MILNVCTRDEFTVHPQRAIAHYLNTVYFDHGTYGIEKATDFYFGKTVCENGQKHTITLSKVTFLASLPKASQSYSRQNIYINYT
ncbi:transglycosylase domain-containing protein [Aneurinibacillus migulanus]|uniref:transglycosylase domain-containing protein n=1 Tax=Aneurinibacillus migulanus TaxID=47500 RepID=UPI00399D51B3